MKKINEILRGIYFSLTLSEKNISGWNIVEIFDK